MRDRISESNRISLTYALPMLAIHLLGVAGVVWFVQNPSWTIALIAMLYFFVFHLSTTVGAHRYFTHEAFTAKPWFARLLAVLHAGTLQGPLMWWVAKHLQHHAYEDQPGRDPHTPKDGFWHSHMLWMLKPAGFGMPPARFLVGFKKPGVRNDTVKWQTKHYVLLASIWLLIVPALLGMLSGDVIGGVLVIGFTRLVFQYHTTWIVNSVGHSDWGERIDARARNFGWRVLAPLFGIITVGESHHANHHVAPGHWRLGRRWWQLDPGAGLIRLATWIGAASDLKEPPNRNRNVAPAA